MYSVSYKSQGWPSLSHRFLLPVLMYSKGFLYCVNMLTSTKLLVQPLLKLRLAIWHSPIFNYFAMKPLNHQSWIPICPIIINHQTLLETLKSQTSFFIVVSNGKFLKIPFTVRIPNKLSLIFSQTAWQNPWQSNAPKKNRWNLWNHAETMMLSAPEKSSASQHDFGTQKNNFDLDWFPTSFNYPWKCSNPTHLSPFYRGFMGFP